MSVFPAGQNCTYSLTVSAGTSEFTKTVYDATPNARFGLAQCPQHRDWREHWEYELLQYELSYAQQRWTEIAGPCSSFSGSYERALIGGSNYTSWEFEVQDMEYAMQACQNKCEEKRGCTAIAFGEESGCTLYLEDLCIPSYDGGSNLNIRYSARGCIQTSKRLECRDLSKPRIVVPVTSGEIPHMPPN